MLTEKRAKAEAMKLLKKAGIVLTPREKEEKFQVVDFGLSDLKHFGLQMIVYINTDRYLRKGTRTLAWTNLR